MSSDSTGLTQSQLVENVALEPGSVLSKRYTVVRKLGAGQSAAVYQCVDSKLGNLPVALKVFPAEIIRDDEQVARFVREIHSNFVIDHDNVVRFYDCLKNEQMIAIVMEYVDGTSLKQLFERHDGAMDWEEVKPILLQLCAGLQAIHDQGILHRDLKPENVVVSDSGVVKIADLGLAVALAGLTEEASAPAREPLKSLPTEMLAHRVTEFGELVGTPFYLSPEYLKQGEVDERSDQYALGLIAYELVTGEFAFNLEKLSKFLPAKIKGDVVPPHLLNRKCSYELSAVIMRAIHVDPEERFDSVRSLEAAFRDPASCLVSDRVAKKLTEMPLVCDEAVAKRLRAERVQGAIESFNRFNPLMYALKFLVVGFGLAIKTARGTARWIFRIVADLVGITPGAIALGFTLFAIIGGLFLASPARYWFSPDNIWGEWRLKPSERQISTVKFISLRIGVNIDGTAKFYRNIRKEIQQMDFREKDNYSPSVKTAPGSQNYRIIAPTEPNSNQKARQQVEPFSKHDEGYRAISPKSK